MSLIYGNLVPVLGEEDANALMTEFPSVEADELMTRQFLRADLRDELTLRMVAVVGTATAVLGTLNALG